MKLPFRTLINVRWLPAVALFTLVAGFGLLWFSPVFGPSLALDAGDVNPVAAVNAPGAASAGTGAPVLLDTVSVPAQVKHFLADQQFWRAAQRMRRYLAGTPDPSPGALLVAARAEAGWGDWGRVRTLLWDRPWLDSVGGGEGWWLLGRALEAGREAAQAADAYRNFLRVATGATEAQRAVVRVRLGSMLLRAGSVEAGLATLDSARRIHRVVRPHITLRMAEILADHGDTARVWALTAELDSAVWPAEVGRVRVRALRIARDPARTRALALASRPGMATVDQAWFDLAAARSALALGDSGAARNELRRAMRTAPASAAARDAAGVLRNVGRLVPVDFLLLARVYDAARNPTRVAAAYQAYLRTDVPGPAERNAVRLRLGRALFAAGRPADAEAAVRPLLAGTPQSADAMLLTARAQGRRGQAAASRATLATLARRFPDSPLAGEALYLLADALHDARQTGAARELYRRILDRHPRSSRASLARMRLGGLAVLDRRYEAAAKLWDAGLATASRGSTRPQFTYWAARAHELRGDSAAARERYRAVVARDPLSYYAVRSADRLGESWQLPGDSVPASALATFRVARWMYPVDVLREAGLAGDADAEAGRAVERAGEDPDLLIPLAIALNERGYTVRGTRIARRLLDAGPEPSRLLLRAMFPLPFRELITAEARARGLDPFMVAAMIRQESTFRPAVSSPAGARGLMQVMPETGRGLARGVGIRNWSPELLFQPEINVHLGTLFLRDQVRAYRGSLPSVFSAYNAGPGRVRRWSRFPEYRNEELFTERIPFEETRDYVKVLTRNMAVYRALYGPPR